MVTRVNRVFITKESCERSVGHCALPICEAGKRSGNLKRRSTPSRSRSVVASGPPGFGRHSPFHAAPCKFSPSVAALETEGTPMTIGTGRVNVLRMLDSGPRDRLCPGSMDHRRSRADGSPHWHRHGRGGRRHFGAVVRISSPALIGGELTTKTDERGQLRFPSVPPGSYALEIVLEGFRPYRDADIRIGAGATIERTPVLDVGSARGLDRGARIRLSPRRPRPRVRNSVRRRGPRRDPDETIQLPGLGQDGARHLADVTGREQCPCLRPRFRRRSESISSRWHEYHRDRQRRLAGRARRRLHSGTADPVRGRVGRIRQCPGRRRERDQQVWRQPLSI